MTSSLVVVGAVVVDEDAPAGSEGGAVVGGDAAAVYAGLVSVDDRAGGEVDSCVAVLPVGGDSASEQGLRAASDLDGGNDAS